MSRWGEGAKPLTQTRPEAVACVEKLIGEGFSYRRIHSITGVSVGVIMQRSKLLRQENPVSQVAPTKTFRDRCYNSIQDIVQHNRESGRRDLEPSPEFLVLKDQWGRRRNIFCQYRAPEYGVQGYEVCAILPSGRIERLSGDREFPTRWAAMKRAPRLAERHDQFESLESEDFG